jgi:hypothetical protein
MVVMVSSPQFRNALAADAFLTGISGAAAAANVRFRAELAGLSVKRKWAGSAAGSGARKKAGGAGVWTV